jgi:D-alanyl-D-alanine carboxypeptidase
LNASQPTKVRVRTGVWLALAGLVFAAAAPGVQEASAGDASPPRTGAAFQSSLTRVMKADAGPPGVAALIVRDGRRQFFSRGAGDLEPRVAPKLNRPFRIASVSKAFNGAVALSLVDRGKLRLGDTIGRLLPNLLPKARRVTLAQLLNHTAGLPDYIRDRQFLDKLVEKPSRYMSPRRLLSFVRDEPLEFRPGSRYGYSDSDNIVIGLMAEKVTGLPYERLLRREIGRRVNITPALMPRSLFLSTPFLHGYEVKAGERPEDVSKFINPALAWASGGIVSNLPVLSRFFRAYVGGRLFGVRERRAQFRWVKGSSSPPGPGVNAAGMALFRYRTRCGTVFGHTGSFPGYRIFAASTADGRNSIAYVVNAQIVPGQGSPRVSALIRRSQVAAVCHALR